MGKFSLEVETSMCECNFPTAMQYVHVSGEIENNKREEPLPEISSDLCPCNFSRNITFFAISPSSERKLSGVRGFQSLRLLFSPCLDITIIDHFSLKSNFDELWYTKIAGNPDPRWLPDISFCCVKLQPIYDMFRCSAINWQEQRVGRQPE